MERKRALGGRRGRKLTESKVHVLGGGVGRAEKERGEVTGGRGRETGTERERKAGRGRGRKDNEETRDPRNTRRHAAAGSVASSSCSAHRQPAAVE